MKTLPNTTIARINNLLLLIEQTEHRLWTNPHSDDAYENHRRIVGLIRQCLDLLASARNQEVER